MPSKIPTQAVVEKALSPYLTETLPDVVSITSSDEYVEAGEHLKAIKTRQRELDELRKTMTRPLDESKRAIMALFDPALTRYANRELALKNAVKEWTEHVERDRRQLEARLRDDQIAEASRIEARAERLRERGKEEQAIALLDSIPGVPMVVADAERVSGITLRGIWKAEVVDLFALLNYCIEHRSVDLMLPNMSALASIARSTRGTVKIPGVRFFEDKNVAVRP